MKKIILFVCLFCLLVLPVRAEYKVDNAIKTVVDNMMLEMDQKSINIDDKNKLKSYEKMLGAFSKIKTKTDIHKQIIGYVSYSLKNKISDLKNKSVEVELELELEHSDLELEHSDLEQSDFIKNVDRDKVKETVVGWHNTERESNGLNAYVINNSLNYSALTWSINLSKKNKTSYTHVRKTGDGFYNYNSILDRFNSLGIEFDYKKGTAFTESVAYQSYSCSKKDCTQDMIKAIKKGFDFFMKEKSWKGPHYNAIVHPYFTDMGFGVAVSGKKYWIVIHYGVGL